MTDATANAGYAPSSAPSNAVTASLLLGLSMFATGAAGYVAECLLATLATYILGSSIDQFSIIMAVMMLMMGAAAFLQKYVGETRLIEKFVAIEVALALLIAFAPIGTYAAFGSLPDHFGIVQFGFILAIGLLIGLEIPLICRINETYAPSLKSNLATVVGADYIGAFLGALAWVSLRTSAPLTELSFYLGMVNLAVAAITFAYFSRLMGRLSAAVCAGALALTAAAVVWGLQVAGGWTLSVEQKLYDAPITHVETTKFQHIVVTERSLPGGDDVRVFINGNLQLSSLDEHIYHQNLVHPAMAATAAHDRVLILGGGDGMALREVLAYPDVREVVLVDLDPRMIALARRHPTLSRLNAGAFEDARVHAQVPAGLESVGYRKIAYDRTGQAPDGPSVQVLNVDAEKFLRTAGGTFDVVIADLPDPNSIELAKLYSREFYAALRGKLAAGGAMVVQSTSPYHARDAFVTIGRTLQAAGWQVAPYHDNVPSFGDWGWHLAWADGRSPGALRRQAARIPDDLSYLTPERARANFVFARGQLDSPRARPSSMMQPIIHALYTENGWRTE